MLKNTNLPHVIYSWACFFRYHAREERCNSNSTGSPYFQWRNSITWSHKLSPPIGLSQHTTGLTGSHILSVSSFTKDQVCITYNFICYISSGLWFYWINNILMLILSSFTIYLTLPTASESLFTKIAHWIIFWRLVCNYCNIIYLANFFDQQLERPVLTI